MVYPRKITPQKWDRIFRELQDGKKSVKAIAFDSNVSRSRVQEIQQDHPLFFGLRHPYKRKDQ